MERGLSVELTHEPSTGPIGGLIRSTLEGRVVFDASSLALLFAADRVDHLFNTVHGVTSLLAKGRSVVTDRYVLSSLAYQTSQGLPMEWVAQINGRAIAPDVTVFLDTGVEECLARIGRRSSREDLFNQREELQAIDAIYRQVLPREEFTGRLVMIDGRSDVETVAKQVREELAGFFPAA
ncbi:dTMP kinase [Flindersiella endophytica]